MEAEAEVAGYCYAVFADHCDAGAAVYVEGGGLGGCVSWVLVVRVWMWEWWELTILGGVAVTSNVRGDDYSSSW